MKNIYDVIIIGAGPAGISSAIQLKRYGINFLIFEKDCVGGLLKNASLVENFPGFPNGITGIGLIELFKKHLSGLEIFVKRENVLNIVIKNNLYKAETENGCYYSKYLVVTSGTKPKMLESIYSKSVKIYYDAYELFDARKKNIAIIGGGDAAFDYALNLSGKNNDIFIIHRSSEHSCIPVLSKKVFQKKNISYFPDIKTEKVYKEKNKIVIECTDKTNSLKKYFSADYLLAAIGREPQLDFIKKITQKRLIQLNGKSLFFAGDVKNKTFRQATISIGEGIRTAMEISYILKNNR